MLRRLTLWRTALWLVAAIMPGCGESTAPTPIPVTANVRVNPAARTLVMGETLQLTATPLDGNNRPIQGRVITWTSTAEETATVSQSGLVTALSQGGATIRATVDGKTGTAVILVAVPEIVAVELDLAALTIEEGVGHQFVATPRDANGQPVPGLGIQWSSSDPGVVQVGPIGSAMALRPGMATITARVHGVSVHAEVTVTADTEYDLLYSGWNGVAGEVPDLLLIDPRDPARQSKPLLPAGLKGGNPAPSPDGTRVAFVVVDPWAHTDIHVADLTTGAVTQLTSGPAFDHQPTWSPDGTRIVFRRQYLGEGGRIWVMNADDGSGLVNLTAGDAEADFMSPRWSPSLPGGGSRIAYTRSAGGMGHLWTMAPDGTDRIQVTGTDVFDNQPDWSPDGTTLAFTRAGMTSSIWLVDADGQNPRILADYVLQQTSPVWSPEGHQVAFASNHEAGGRYEIYTVWVTGPARLARRTDDPSDKATPVWVKRQ